jgi:hypothetical protein
VPGDRPLEHAEAGFDLDPLERGRGVEVAADGLRVEIGADRDRLAADEGDELVGAAGADIGRAVALVYVALWARRSWSSPPLPA